MKVSEKNNIKNRIYLIASIFLLGFFLLISKAYKLQIKESDFLRKKAEKDYINKEILLSKRGTIFDRKGRPLALSVEAKSIYARPYLIKDKKRTAYRLAKIIGDPWYIILKKLKKNRPFVWIKRRVPDEWVKKIMKLGIKGIGFKDATRRYYPGMELAAHVIGFSGVDNQGLEGIEKKYDNILKAHEIKLVEIKDALKRPLLLKNSSYGSSKNIVLTIDRDIQFKVQTELKKAVFKYHAKSGQCIVMDPYTGEILAMAVIPEFNPNLFNKYKPSYWRNRVITDCYEPGSVIKPFLVAAAIEEGVVTPKTIIFCENGSYRIADHVIHDVHKHGKLTVSEVIMVSSNIGAVKIGEKLGYNKFYNYLKKFGFGQKTGIDLIGERAGNIRKLSKHMLVDQSTVFFGQGISVTSIQLATAMAVIANGGLLIRPYVVKEIIDSHGKVIKKTHTKIIRRVISEKTSEQVKRMMELVVSKKGTAPNAAINGFKVAGKTGTAQKIDPNTGRYSNSKFIATFVGFVPAEKPRFLILVTINEPKKIYYAGIVAAPVFKKIAQWTLDYLGINPHKSKNNKIIVVEKEKSNDIKNFTYRLKIKTKMLPNLKGMSIREVLRIASKNKIKIIIKGYGFAFKQYPKPGTPIKRIKTLKVYFKPIRSI